MKQLFVFAILAMNWTVVPRSGAQQLSAGAATSNITPPIGEPIVGGFVPAPSTHIHDELHARCLVLDDGRTKLALVVCDLLGIHRVVSDEARKLIAERCAIPPQCVLISATHTHSASSALGQNRLLPDQAPDEYQRFVARRIADGVSRALRNRRPAELAFGTAAAPEHVFNRRWFMKTGTVPINPFGGFDRVKMNPPAGSPNLTEPAGPTDPTISFFSVREPNARPIGLFAAYSLHYVGGEEAGHVSADYYGAFAEKLQQLVTGQTPDTVRTHDDPPFVAMMANGTSGDINNINFRSPRPGRKPYEQIRFVAEDVARKVHAAMQSLHYDPHVALAAVYREPTIDWRHPTPEQRKWAQDTIAAGAKSKSDLSFIYAQRTLQLAEYPKSTTVPLQALRIGPTCVGTMPFEVFSEIGLEFKRRSPVQPAFLVELAHGYFGYLPTPRHHELGGYETWIGTNRVEPQASEKLLDALLDMVAGLNSPR